MKLTRTLRKIFFLESRRNFMKNVRKQYVTSIEWESKECFVCYQYFIRGESVFVPKSCDHVLHWGCFKQTQTLKKLKRHRCFYCRTHLYKNPKKLIYRMTLGQFIIYFIIAFFFLQPIVLFLLISLIGF